MHHTGANVLRVEQSYGVVRRITILHTQDTTGGDLNNTSSEGSWHRHTRGCLAALAAGNATHSSRRASPRPSARAQAARRRHGASARPRGAVCSCGCAASPTPPRLPTNHTHTHTNCGAARAQAHCPRPRVWPSARRARCNTTETSWSSR